MLPAQTIDWWRNRVEKMMHCLNIMMEDRQRKPGRGVWRVIFEELRRGGGRILLLDEKL